MIVYGGSFDPPHLGHLLCVETAIRLFSGAEILIVPSKTPVRKHSQEKPAFASFSDRLEMCRLAFKKPSAPLSGIITVSTIEEELSGPGYSVRTLNAIARVRTGQNLCFMMGDDQWENFVNWYMPLEVLRMASILVIRRDCKTKIEFTDMLLRVCRQLGESHPDSTVPGLVRLRDLGAQVYYSSLDPLPATSSRLRDLVRFSKGEKQLTNELEVGVSQYIENQKMYQSTERK